MSSSSLNDKSGLILIIAGLSLMIGALVYYFGNFDTPSNAATPAKEQSETNQTSTPSLVNIDVQAALAPRSIGSKDAPVKIHEFASLTCGHCAHFHKTIFKTLKAQYVDTGKVQIIFSDFPLNEPALYGSMIARCLPADQYEPFVQTLMENQDKWAFDDNYMKNLQGYAEKFGMDADTFKACTSNQALQQGLINNMQAAARQWEVSATPSFLINNKILLTGVKPIEEFAAAIDAELTAAAPQEK